MTVSSTPPASEFLPDVECASSAVHGYRSREAGAKTEKGETKKQEPC